MYKIIGADQKEYGPVSADQLRQWMAEGRVNAQTLVRAEGQDAWQPLGTLAEFAGAVPVTPAPFAGVAGFQPAMNREEGLRRLKPIGIALMVMGILTVLVSFANIGGYFMSGPAEKTGNPTLDRFLESANKPQAVVFGVVQLACGVLIAVAGVKARQAKSLKLVQTAAILAMLPCTASCCCVIGTPLGIWALITLNKPEVKALFDS